jgi:hypothetical protein
MESRLTVEQAAKQMNMPPHFLRLALQAGKFDFGIAVKRKRWAYYINAERFNRYIKGLA